MNIISKTYLKLACFVSPSFMGISEGQCYGYFMRRFYIRAFIGGGDIGHCLPSNRKTLAYCLEAGPEKTDEEERKRKTENIINFRVDTK